MAMRLIVLAMVLLAARPALAGMPADCSKGPVPDGAVHGTVNGKPFVPQEATLGFTKDGMVVNDVHLDRYVLSIQTDGIFNALSVDMMVPGGKKPDGRTFRVLPVDDIDKQPAAAEGTPEVQGWDLEQENAGVKTSFTEDTASIQVVFGMRKGNVMPGKIHMCVPGVSAEIVGSFSATMQ
ncbi:MAG: hypothetical protein ISS15_09545 [Alphaproteobacteria bacterium]|nr:hypothetical protein [Alphaproteobacteria bacterium]MBL6938753.1 hypothetical protein [Alphaproteobacteria bacterium]MBL7097890.1 hypothetical protein [Alphaproteobacteria bacterium]